ncbi:hypothetical protein Q0Z83_060620 [Actinoplanes sichuanensis]|uniref:DUF222 domain-containing protein n=1 Tax=Actinoplanes sichuanensis TaxID=512349 RepID=A0ABW4A6I7_9ACTN|nr:hypothetical protein [Actinoplanes sichuanensis]BEL07871.1 hypothetical protein Q0Z83_060620 [Actinoplanes sichuanensis]
MTVIDSTTMAADYYRMRDRVLAQVGCIPRRVCRLALDQRYADAIAELEHITGAAAPAGQGVFADEVAPLTAKATTDMRNRALAHIQAEVHNAGPETLAHFARMSEALCSTVLGEQMRDLVDDERSRQMFALAHTRPGLQAWAIREERWERAGKVGHPADPEYDDFFYQGRDSGEGGSQR